MLVKCHVADFLRRSSVVLGNRSEPDLWFIERDRVRKSVKRADGQTTHDRAGETKARIFTMSVDAKKCFNSFRSLSRHNFPQYQVRLL